jgi:modulator of FtsH protease HflC
MFQVGEMGSGGVIDKVIPFAQSRVLDAFGKVNALEITNRKTQIESELLVAIQAQAIELFGERVEDVQITIQLESEKGGGQPILVLPQQIEK